MTARRGAARFETARHHTARGGAATFARRRALWPAVLAALALTVTACSGVPSSSSPQVVRTLNVNPASASPAPPAADADQRTIVAGFLRSNSDHDPSHLAAQQYLTKVAAAAWKPNSQATILDADAPSVPAADGSVTLRGRVVGTLNAGGTFSLPSSTAPFLTSFKFQKAGASYRITTPPAGLLLPSAAFSNDYSLLPLYFLNPAQKTLVPDVRYTSLKQQSLADWLLAQLLIGPAPGGNLTNAVPSQIDQKNAKVTVGSPIVFQLPGFKNVPAPIRTRIAAELAYTFRTADFADRALEIQDGTTTVQVLPGQPTFSVATLPASFAPINAAANSSAYFVRGGKVFDSSGRQANDTFGGSTSGVESVAVESTGFPIPLVATVATGGRSVTLDTSQRSFTVKLATPAQSRPEWARDGSNEVWLGVGRDLERITPSGARGDVPFAAPPGSSQLTPRAVTAVRFSPDGARVALVLADVGSGKSSSAWVGNVVRSGSSVTVAGLHQFTPTGWYVRDVTWTDGISLQVIDNAVGSYAFTVYSVRLDGSDATVVSANEDLPGPPRYIAAGPGTTWVSVPSGKSSTLWRLSNAAGAGWVTPFGASTYVGTAPVYST